MHVSYGRHYAEVGKFFRRDRTTVSHACALVEELREDRNSTVIWIASRIRLPTTQAANGRWLVPRTGKAALPLRAGRAHGR